MSNISTYLANKLLDHSWGKTSYPIPTCYVALFTTNPTMPAGTGGVEVSGGSYVREALAGNLAAAAAGSIATNLDITWPQASADWGTVTGVGIYDAPTGGNLLNAGALTVSKTVGSGDTFKIASSNLSDALT